MKFLKDPGRVLNVLDHILREDLVKAIVLDWVWKDVQVVDDVGLRIRRNIEANGPCYLRGAASDIENRPGSSRHEIVAVWSVSRLRADAGFMAERLASKRLGVTKRVTDAYPAREGRGTAMKVNFPTLKVNSPTLCVA